MRLFQRREKPKGVEDWSLWREEVHGLALVKRLGEPGRRHVVTGLHGSFNIAHVGLLTIRVGEGALGVKTYCHNQRSLEHMRVVIPAGEAVSAGLMFRGDLKSLPDSAAATVLLLGYTEPAEE